MVNGSNLLGFDKKKSTFFKKSGFPEGGISFSNLTRSKHFILNAQYIGALLKEDGKEGLKPINLDSVIGEGDRIENN
jgi:hypothetical protein